MLQDFLNRLRKKDLISSNHKILMFEISLFFIMFIFLMLTLIFYNNYIMNKNIRSLQEYINISEWNMIKGLIEENRDKSRIIASDIASNIKSEITVVYGKDYTRLKKDIILPSNDSDLSKILSDVTKDVSINVKNDNNDPFIANNNGILSDKSLNCSKEIGQVRTWQNEISLHYNKILAKKAIDSIRNRTNNLVFWEFLTPEHNSSTIITEMSYDELRKKFIVDGLDGLKTYEFLVSVYLDDTITDDEVPVNKIGQLNNTYTLIVNQGFNVYDLIQLRYMGIFEHNKILLNQLQQRKIDLNRISNIILLIFLVSILIIFLSIYSYIKYYIRQVRLSFPELIESELERK